MLNIENTPDLDDPVLFNESPARIRSNNDDRTEISKSRPSRSTTKKPIPRLNDEPPRKKQKKSIGD